MSAIASTEAVSTHPEPVRGFPFIVDGTEFISDRPHISGLQIMERAGIPPDVGLIEIGEDGVQRPVTPDQIIDLNQPHRFRRPPRFKRG